MVLLKIVNHGGLYFWRCDFGTICQLDESESIDIRVIEAINELSKISFS